MKIKIIGDSCHIIMGDSSEYHISALFGYHLAADLRSILNNVEFEFVSLNAATFSAVFTSSLHLCTLESYNMPICRNTYATTGSFIYGEFDNILDYIMLGESEHCIFKTLLEYRK